jgi:hypothetical protein
MCAEFRYDAFLSYSSKDRPIVQELAQRLKADGLRVWFDEWEIQPGDMIGLSIEQALEQSRALVLCMSANAFSSDWVMFERGVTPFQDQTNQECHVLPPRLERIDIRNMGI